MPLEGETPKSETRKGYLYDRQVVYIRYYLGAFTSALSVADLNRRAAIGGDESDESLIRRDGART